AIIDFAGKSIATTLKYFPREKVRTKPGGNAGGVNPIAWGTWCPGYAKMASQFNARVAATDASPWEKRGGSPRTGIVLQPADWRGACFGDKWVATAYRFYGVTLSTEPAGALGHGDFIKSLFSDMDCGARQVFTYDCEKHADDVRRYVHLVTGQSGETETAVLCPTTLYRLGGDLSPTIRQSDRLRDVANFDVLDELLIADGALRADRYKILL